MPPDDDLDGYGDLGDANGGGDDSYGDDSYGIPDEDAYGDSTYGGGESGQGYLDVGGPGASTTVTSTMYDNSESHGNSTIYAIPMAEDDGAEPGAVTRNGSAQVGTIVAQRNGGETYEVIGEGLYAPAKGSTLEARARAGSVYQGFNGDDVNNEDVEL